MGITMPVVSGIEALKSIRVLDPKAKIVMLSAIGQEGMVREEIMFGAKSFIINLLRMSM